MDHSMKLLIAIKGNHYFMLQIGLFYFIFATIVDLKSQIIFHIFHTNNECIQNEHKIGSMKTSLFLIPQVMPYNLHITVVCIKQY